MYKRVEECLTENNYLPMKGEILGISGIKNFYSLINMEESKLTETIYPDVDMQDLPFKDRQFDFVICDQVIEHIVNPAKAIDESYRVLKKGGIIVYTTCFMNYIHGCPIDLWRFSPDALEYLCKDFSKIFQAEGWGNRIALLLCLMYERFRFMNIPDNKWSLRHLIATWNEKSYPIVTWVVARK